MVEPLVNWFLDDVVEDHFFFYDKWHFLLHNEGYLHLDWLHFGLVYKHFLILDAISVGLDWHLFNNLNRNSSLYFYLHIFLFCHCSFHYSLDFDSLDFFLFADYLSVNIYLDGDLDLLDYYLRNWNFNDLQHCFVNYYYFLDNFGYLYDFLNDTRNHNNFLYYLFDLDYSGYFNYFLNDSVDELLLNFDDFFLNNDGNWFVNMDGFNYFLSSRYNLYFLYFNFFDLLRYARDIDFIYDWHLLSDVEWHYFLNLNVFGDKNFLNDWSINEDFNFSYRFFSVAFDKMRALDEHLLGYFSDDFLFHFQFSVNWFFNSICQNNRSISEL